MEEKELNYIGEELYKDTLKDKANGLWTKNDLEMERKLYQELNELGFDFSWHMQLSPACFTKKNKEIVPIFLKYFGKFDDNGLNDICIYCLGVQGLNESVDFLLEQLYKTNPKESPTKSAFYNSLCNAIYRIKDPTHIDDYINLISNESNLFGETGLLLELLGRLKSQKAIPYLIKLLDYDISLEKSCNINSIRLSAIRALGYYKEPALASHIEKFLEHKNSVVRQTAKASLKKLKRME